MNREVGGRLEGSLSGISDVFAREAHLRSILETVPDAMIVIDELGRIISFSTAAERMFGYSESDLLGENVSTLMPSPDRERHDGYLSRYLATGERSIIGIGRLTTARRRDGTTFPIHLHVGEARIDDARVFTGFIQDLTERQRTERELHNLQSELAHVSRITEVGALATSIAHELTQPLTAVVYYAETAYELLENPDAETVASIREAMRDCVEQSIRAGQIVRRLRDFMAHGEIERQSESLSRLISEASALAMIGAKEQGVEFAVNLDASADAVLVDRIQIQQVLLNLMRNAIEAMAGSQVRQLEVRSRRESDGFIGVTVADSGPGLSPEIADKLFEPFVTTKAEGMGIGLSICQTIVRAHEGEIRAEPSRLGGTAFHFTLINAEEAQDV